MMVGDRGLSARERRRRFRQRGFIGGSMATMR